MPSQFRWTVVIGAGAAVVVFATAATLLLPVADQAAAAQCHQLDRLSRRQSCNLFLSFREYPAAALLWFLGLAVMVIGTILAMVQQDRLDGRPGGTFIQLARVFIPSRTRATAADFPPASQSIEAPAETMHRDGTILGEGTCEWWFPAPPSGRVQVAIDASGTHNVEVTSGKRIENGAAWLTLASVGRESEVLDMHHPLDRIIVRTPGPVPALGIPVRVSVRHLSARA